MAVRVDFSSGGRHTKISRQDRAHVMAAAKPAGAALGIDSRWGPESGWAGMDVNREDPVELELAADLHVSALSHVVGSTCNSHILRSVQHVY